MSLTQPYLTPARAAKRMHWSVLAGVMLTVAGIGLAPVAMARDGSNAGHWVATWSASPQSAFSPADPSGVTILQIAHVRCGRQRAPVRRSNPSATGCLVLGRHRKATASLGLLFKHSRISKTYWAVVEGGPAEDEGTIDMPLGRLNAERGWWQKPDPEGQQAITKWKVMGRGDGLAWMAMEPVTGRTHQLRAHMAHVGNPIIGDPKYFNSENWELPGGIQNKLHLLARRIVVPHPRGGTIDISAPLPPHMQQSWNLLGFDANRYDPIEQAPEEE